MSRCTNALLLVSLALSFSAGCAPELGGAAPATAASAVLDGDPVNDSAERPVRRAAV